MHTAIEICEASFPAMHVNVRQRINLIKSRVDHLMSKFLNLKCKRIKLVLRILAILEFPRDGTHSVQEEGCACVIKVKTKARWGL